MLDPVLGIETVFLSPELGVDSDPPSVESEWDGSASPLALGIDAGLWAGGGVLAALVSQDVAESDPVTPVGEPLWMRDLDFPLY